MPVQARTTSPADRITKTKTTVGKQQPNTITNKKDKQQQRARSNSSIQIVSEEEKRNKPLCKKISVSEAGEVLESQYVSLRVHYVRQCRILESHRRKPKTSQPSIQQNRHHQEFRHQHERQVFTMAIHFAALLPGTLQIPAIPSVSPKSSSSTPIFLIIIK